MQRVRDLGTRSPKWDVFIKSFPSGSGNYVDEEIERALEPVGIEEIKEMVLSRHNRTDTHSNSQTSSVHGVCTGPSQMGFQH